MKTQHIGLAVLGLVLSSGAALAQTIITQQPAVSETIVTTQPVGQPLVLTPAQRTTVYRTVKQQSVAVAPAAVEVVEVQVGQPVPANVQLYAIPETVGVEVPAIKSYKYMYVNNRVVLVDPATSLVVGEIAE